MTLSTIRSPASNQWEGKRVLVTGGASFIGSHLVDALVAKGAQVRVVDNLSTGLLENISNPNAPGAIEFHQEDLFDPVVARRNARERQIAFHLAADHGGRGY